MIVRPRLRLFAARHLTSVLLASAMACCPLFAAGFEAFPAEDAPQIAEASLPAATLRRVESMAHVATGLLEFDDDPDVAFHHYLKALDLDPSNKPLAQQVASMHLHRGEIPEALSILKDSLKRNPESPTLALRIASIYVVSLRKFDIATRYAKQALQSAPDYIEAYQMLFSIYRVDDRNQDITRLLKQAENHGKDDPEFQAGLADLLVRQQYNKNTEDGSAQMQPALDHYRRAAALAQQNASVLQRSLNFFFANNNPEDVITCARRLLILDPADTAVREKLALALTSLELNDEAIVELEKVVQDNPASLLAYRTHGEILIKQNDLSGALEKFEKALVLNDSDPRLYLELVDLCLKDNNVERAIWWLSQARTKFSKLPELPYYEAQLLSQLQRWQEASNTYSIAEDLAACYQPSFLTPDFYFQRGIALERSGDRDAAIASFRKCLSLDEDHIQALNYLGYMWAEHSENLNEAETFIRKALALAPETPAYLDSLGWVLYQQGRYHEAFAELEKASKLSNPADSTIEEHLGDTLEKLGRHSEAIKAWNLAATLEGASPHLHAKLRAAQRTDKQ